MPDIIQALQYCERAHGYAKIASAYTLITGALDSAVTLIPSNITLIGIQRQLANPGLFIGASTRATCSINAPINTTPPTMPNTNTRRSAFLARAAIQR